MYEGGYGKLVFFAGFDVNEKQISPGSSRGAAHRAEDVPGGSPLAGAGWPSPLPTFIALRNSGARLIRSARKRRVKTLFPSKDHRTLTFECHPETDGVLQPNQIEPFLEFHVRNSSQMFQLCEVEIYANPGTPPSLGRVDSIVTRFLHCFPSRATMRHT